MPDPLNPVFFQRLTDWQRVHGRHDLPWQGSGDPYRVWVSEIMLQQTQVRTVLDYYPRFLSRFPTVQALAAADLDEVLGLWSGLGYYSRARHLHRCAREVVERFQGVFPVSAAALAELPGIGDSTAAAIAAFCQGERVSICDGNVRRVLSRLLAFEGDLAQLKAQRQLWARAQALVPPQASAPDMVAYTQGLMDLGATVCRRSRPLCSDCPVSTLCAAHRDGREADFPVKTRRLKRRTERWDLQVWSRADGAVWLQRRPLDGIWAGLHAFPDQAPGSSPDPEVTVLHHALTHRDLVLHLHRQDWNPDAPPGPEESGVWLLPGAALDMGLPAPLRRWLVAQGWPD